MKRTILITVAIAIITVLMALYLIPNQSFVGLFDVTKKGGDEVGKQKEEKPAIAPKFPAQREHELSDRPAVRSQQQAEAVVSANKPSLGLGDQDQLEIGAGSADEQGNAYYPLQQRHRGIPVYSARSVLEVENGQAVVISGSWQENIDVDITPTYDALTAVTIALKKIGMADDLALTLRGESQLIIYPATLRHHLAWLVDVQFIKPPLAAETMIVDAHDPEVIARMPALLQ